MFLKNQIPFFLLFILAASLQNCQKEENVQPLIEIDQNLLPYFERFEAEAEARGISANVTAEVSGKLAVIEGEETVAGQCRHFTETPNVVVVDPAYWQSATELEKEYLIFHELGHCSLQRSHLDTKNVSGNCLSIMQSGQNNCRMSYNYNTREEYLNELFSN